MDITESVSNYIIASVCNLASEYGVECNMELQFVGLVIRKRFPAIKRKVDNKGLVILVDEYDLSVMNEYLDDGASSRLNEKEIQAFFGALKESSSFICSVYGSTVICSIYGNTVKDSFTVLPFTLQITVLPCTLQIMVTHPLQVHFWYNQSDNGWRKVQHT